MAWFPVRERNGTVLPENLYFNQPMASAAAISKGNSIKGKRASNGRGTPHKRALSENRGPAKRHYTKYLAENAMRMGFLNGVKLSKVAR
jgi:hypothetical protein